MSVPHADFIRRFSAIRIADVSLVGGKNASLGEMYSSLTEKGVRVPDGFAVTAAGYRHFLAESGLDRANRDRAVADLRNQAKADVPMRLAREAGRRAVEQSFAMPLRAAGFSSAKVVARYPTEGDGTPAEYIDHSRSYNEVLSGAR